MKVHRQQPGDKPRDRLGLRAPRGSAKAKNILKRLSQDEFRQATQYTEAQIALLDMIASPRPPRNAIAALKALELKAAYAYAKPKSEVEHSGGLTIEVITGIDDPPSSAGGTD